MILPVFDKKQAMYVYELAQLLEMAENDQLHLRETNKAYVRQIRTYIMENFEQQSVYLPPLVAAIKEGSLTGNNPRSLQIIDGSHRLKALLSIPKTASELMYSAEQKKSSQAYTIYKAYSTITIAVQVYEGMNEEECNQLYLDLNTMGKKVALSKLISYDSRDEINLITNRLLQNNVQLQIAKVETEKAAIVRPNNKKFMSLSQLRNIVGIFSTGKDVASKLSVKMDKHVNFEEAYELADLWLQQVFKLYPPQKIGDYEISMLASYPLQLALVHYALHGLKSATLEQKKQIIEERMERLGHVNWHRDQEVWQQFDGVWQRNGRYYFLAKDKKTIQALVKWLNRKGGE